MVIYMYSYIAHMYIDNLYTHTYKSMCVHLLLFLFLMGGGGGAKDKNSKEKKLNTIMALKCKQNQTSSMANKQRSRLAKTDPRNRQQKVQRRARVIYFPPAGPLPLTTRCWHAFPGTFPPSLEPCLTPLPRLLAYTKSRSVKTNIKKTDA